MTEYATRFVADKETWSIEGLHLLPIGTRVMTEKGEYEVEDCEFFHLLKRSYVVVYLSTKESIEASSPMAALAQAAMIH